MTIIVNKGLAIPTDKHIPSPRVTGAPENVISVTPSDIDKLPYTCRKLWADVAGTISVSIGAQTNSFTVLAGTWYDIRADKINATGTSATGIKAGR